ncbi:MAG: nucleotidyl transferase AbiEii/AbiGii toxin family protein [Myxococcota bacterium]
MALFPDFRDLLAEFAACDVEFVPLGGYAVAFHGRPRSTKDIDFLVSTSPENRARLANALNRFGAPESIVEGARQLSSDEVLYFGVDPTRVDILGSASGVTFGPVFERAVIAELDGIAVRVISRDDLITNKLASGRPRDLQDAEELLKFGPHDE